MKDKTLLKVSGIVAMVCGGLCCLTIIGAIIGIPLLIGGSRMIDFSKMEDSQLEKYKTHLLVWSIIFLIFALPAGILGIIYYVGMYFDINDLVKDNYINELEKLKKLYDEKAITKEEYDKLKKEILDKKIQN